MRRVIIGMDPHKRSATIEVIDEREKFGQGRFGTDSEGYQTMLKLGRTYRNRVWAVEGSYGIGRHIAQRLVADGETVLDVAAKLSARVRLFATGQGRKSDPVDAHSVAVAALRSAGLRQVVADDVSVALRLLVDRRDVLGRARTDTINRLCRIRHSRFYADRAVMPTCDPICLLHKGIGGHAVGIIRVLRGTR